MYIGGTDERAMHHLVAELLDNAMDEAVAGHAANAQMTEFLREFQFRDSALAHDPAFTSDSFSPHSVSGAMREDLLQAVPPDRAPAVRHQIELLDRAVDRAFVDPEDRAAAGCPDHQGIGT